jgi:hypothetical protein
MPYENFNTHINMKYFFITSLLILQLIDTSAQNQNQDIESFLDFYIAKSVSDSLLGENPIIVVEGYHLDSSNQEDFFNLLEVSDIQSLDVLSADKATEIFDNGQNGVLLVSCKKQGKKKIRKLMKGKGSEK